MNLKSDVEGETRPILHLSKWQVYDWFTKAGGKEISPKEKTLDTPEH